MYQEINGRFNRISGFNVRYNLFKIDRWENRIYVYEPGLLYSYNFPAFYGSGTKLTGVFRINNPVAYAVCLGEIKIIQRSSRDLR